MSYTIDDSKRSFLRDKIVTGAQKYKNRLMNKRFLIICEDGQEYMISFFYKDFLHLTGISSNLDETRFFRNSYKGLLSTGNIHRQQKYNWSTLKSKATRIELIDQIIYANVQNSLFMENLHTNTYDYNVAIRNTTINTCVGFKGSIHKARTLRKASNSTNASTTKKILAIFSKQPNELVYNELVYINSVNILLNKNSDIINSLSNEIKSKFTFITSK